MGYLALREVQETRTKPTWDGSVLTEIKDAKIVERFVEMTSNDMSYNLTAVLLKVKAKGGAAFYAVADLDIDPDGTSWIVEFPENLEITEEEGMIAQDYIFHALKSMNIGKDDEKIRISYKHEIDKELDIIEEEEEEEEEITT
jgi:hypothetical protein